MTDKEWRELEDILIDTGLDVRKAEDICLLLRYKPDNVQRAFYLRCKGWTLEEIGKVINVSKQQVFKYMDENCEDIKKYLNNRQLNG